MIAADVRRLFVGGPRDGQREPVLTAVPSGRIRQFADPPVGLVCADEQVIVEIGAYVRSGMSDVGEWCYVWHPKGDA